MTSRLLRYVGGLLLCRGRVQEHVQRKWLGLFLCSAYLRFWLTCSRAEGWDAARW
ncbi:MAG: hypothetical protein ACXVXP_06345 [Mycobacteriaceae bacterium]